MLSAIGDGAMGSVYRAGRIGLEREVAVKFIDSRIARDASFRKRFELELQAMGRLQAPQLRRRSSTTASSRCPTW